MSKEIDWSKAPEGATHRVSGFIDEWRKSHGCDWSAWYEDKWRPIIKATPDMYIPRPASKPWTGEGLPPVGTVCEYRCVGTWVKVEVFAIKPNGNGSSSALFTYEDGAWHACAHPSAFRPLRTPEQIAAEDRLAALDEMVFGAIGADRDGNNTTAFLICGFLYDAGYRKVEGGAE